MYLKCPSRSRARRSAARGHRLLLLVSLVLPLVLLLVLPLVLLLLVLPLVLLPLVLPLVLLLVQQTQQRQSL